MFSRKTKWWWNADDGQDLHWDRGCNMHLIQAVWKGLKMTGLTSFLAVWRIINTRRAVTSGCVASARCEMGLMKCETAVRQLIFTNRCFSSYQPTQSKHWRSKHHHYTHTTFYWLLPGESRLKVKVKVHTLDIAPLRSESPQQKHSDMAHVLKGFHSFTCTPTRSSTIGMSHTWFCLPSCSWYSFTDPGGMEGWVDLSAK